MANKKTTKKARASSKDEEVVLPATLATDSDDMSTEEEGAAIRRSPLIQEGNDFQGDFASKDGEGIVEVVPKEEGGFSLPHREEGGRTEPTRHHGKPANWGKTDEELEEAAEASEKAAADAEKGEKKAVTRGVSPETADALAKALRSALSDADVARATDSDVAETKKALAAAPKSRFMIPLGIGERAGAVESVTINGYRLSIQKGVLVELPMPVVNILMEHLNIRSEAAAQFDVHRDSRTEEMLAA